MEHLLLDHVFVQHGRYHSDGDDSTAGLDDVLNGLVGQSHHVLSIHLHKVNDIVVCYFNSLLSLVVFLPQPGDG